MTHDDSSFTSIEPDPIDEEAATIDARAEDAPERIEELVQHAQQPGRDAELAGGPIVASENDS